MADATATLDARAQELYDAHRKARGYVTAFGRVMPSWSGLDNNQREIWRGAAQADMCSKETLADELKREDRERRSPLAARGDSSE